MPTIESDHMRKFTNNLLLDKASERLRIYLIGLDTNEYTMSCHEYTILDDLVAKLSRGLTPEQTRSAYKEAYNRVLIAMTAEALSAVTPDQYRTPFSFITRAINTFATFKSPYVLAFWINSCIRTERLYWDNQTNAFERWLDTDVLKLLRECIKDLPGYATDQELQQLQRPAINWYKVGVFAGATAVAATGMALNHLASDSEQNNSPFLQLGN